MILAIVIILVGIFFGILAGLIPGIHTNLISVILLSLSPILLQIFSPLNLVLFIVSLSIANIFFEVIPTIYLGAPNEETALSTMPGHEYLLKGKGHQAVFLASLGNISGILISLVVIPLFFLFLVKAYPFFEKMMLWLLVWICIFIIKDEKQKILAIIFFILSGFLGFSSLNLNINQALFSLLTGLFGTSGLIYSLNEQANIPSQETSLDKINKRKFIKPLISSFLISPICSFLPGLGSSQATVIGSKITREIERDQFLFLNGSINSALMTLSFVTLFLIDKSRTGSAAVISQITKLSLSNLILIIIIIFLISLVLFLLTIFVSEKVANLIGKLNYQKISISILIFLIILVFFISGFLGLLVLITGTCLGLSCQYYGLRKGILMGCLLIPTIIIYWRF
jgi:putative membrane protein